MAQCGSNADCSNTIGSFTCDCKPGFAGSGNECIGECPEWKKPFRQLIMFSANLPANYPQMLQFDRLRHSPLGANDPFFFSFYSFI